MSKKLFIVGDIVLKHEISGTMVEIDSGSGRFILEIEGQVRITQDEQEPGQRLLDIFAQKRREAFQRLRDRMIELQNSMEFLRIHKGSIRKMEDETLLRVAKELVDFNILDSKYLEELRDVSITDSS